MTSSFYFICSIKYQIETKMLEHPSSETGLAMIRSEELDEASGYSHAYLTSVFHDDIEALKRVLKRHFHKVSNRKAPLETFMDSPDKSFDNDIAELNLEDKCNPDKEDLE